MGPLGRTLVYGTPPPSLKPQSRNLAIVALQLPYNM